MRFRHTFWRAGVRWRAWRRQDEEVRANFWARLSALAATVLALYVLWPIWEKDASAVGKTEIVDTVQNQMIRTKSKTRTVETSTHQEKATEDDGPVAAIVEETGLLVMARIALIGITAFLVGLATQRILLADFAIKAGPVEVPPISSKRVSDPLTKILQAMGA